MKKLILLSIMLVFLFSAVNADYLVKQETVTPSIMGQPGKTEVANLWIGDGVYANVGKGQSVIIDSKKKLMTIVYPSSKTYVEMKLPLDISTYLPAEAKTMMEPMLKSIKIKVSENGKNEKVGNWKTKGYSVLMSMKMMGVEMKSNMEIYATQDVPFDWKKVSTEFLGNMMQSTGQMNQKVVNEMKKINGYAVKTIVTVDMMGIKFDVKINVLEILKKDAPAGTFTVPTGFNKVDKITVKRGM